MCATTKYVKASLYLFLVQFWSRLMDQIRPMIVTTCPTQLASVVPVKGLCTKSEVANLMLGGLDQCPLPGQILSLLGFLVLEIVDQTYMTLRNCFFVISAPKFEETQLE